MKRQPQNPNEVKVFEILTKHGYTDLKISDDNSAFKGVTVTVWHRKEVSTKAVDEIQLLYPSAYQHFEGSKHYIYLGDYTQNLVFGNDFGTGSDHSVTCIVDASGNFVTSDPEKIKELEQESKSITN